MPEERPALDPAELSAYFSLIEVSSLLKHTVEQQLRDAGHWATRRNGAIETIAAAAGDAEAAS